MTYGKLKGIWDDLKELGYPLSDNTEIILDLNMCNRKEIVGFAFEDNGYRVTIKREIEDEYDNERRCS